jgi:hypothetical protein
VRPGHAPEADTSGEVGAMPEVSFGCGGMFFGPWEHRRVDKVFERGYEISLSGTDLGQFAIGGGPDGDFNIWRLKHAQIRGAFDVSGLRVSMDASTWRGSSVCYGLGESREDEYEALQLTVQFTVPPRDLVEFMGLRISLRHEVFSRFKWGIGDEP